MRRRLSLALALMAGLVAVGTGLLFWWNTSSCPTPVLPLLHLVIVGLATWGTAMVSGRALPVPVASGLLWVLCGALLASAVAAVWSFGAWVLPAALAAAAANITLGEGRVRRFVPTLTLLVVGAAINFAGLFWLTRATGVDTVPLPATSQVARSFASVDYADAYRIRLPASDPPHGVDDVAQAWLAQLSPCWSRSLARRPTLADRALENGQVTDFAPVVERGPGEIVLGEDAMGLRYRVAVSVANDAGVQFLTVSTVVRYARWWGRLYFAPIRVGHQIIVPQTVRGAAAALHE